MPPFNYFPFLSDNEEPTDVSQIPLPENGPGGMGDVHMAERAQDPKSSGLLAALSGIGSKLAPPPAPPSQEDLSMAETPEAGALAGGGIGEVGPNALPGANPAPRSPGQPAPAPANPVTAYIQKKYGPSSQQDLIQAQQLAHDLSSIAGYGRAASKLGAAFSRGTVSPNDPFYDKLEANAQQPVENLLQQRKMGQEDLKFNAEAAKLDPNSPSSMSFKNTLLKLYPHEFKPEDLANVSANDMDLIFKPLQLKEQIEARKQAAALMAQFRDTQLNERLDSRAHQANLMRVKTDKTFNDMTNNANNLENAVNMIDQTGIVPKQAFADLQNIVIGNMGVTNKSAAFERADRYAHSMGINAKDLVQFLTGEPQDIGRDNPLFNYYKELANIEVNNYKRRAGERASFLTSGNNSMYAHRPDLASDLDSITHAGLNQFNGPQGGTSQGGGVTATKGGHTYQKVPGGWQLVE